MSTPTQKSLAKMKRLGYVCAIVERWNAHAGIRQDLFGFIDILAVGPVGTVAVQSTSKSNFSSRYGKITGRHVPKDKKEEDRMLKVRENVLACLSAGWSIEIHGWEKGDTKNPRIEVVSMDSLNVIGDDAWDDDLPF